MKKTILLFAFAVYTSSSIFAVVHGSLIQKKAPLNVEVDWTHGYTFPPNCTIDYKIVTIGGKLWATMIGTGYTLKDNPWSSQIRFYDAYFELDRSSAPSNCISWGDLTNVTAYPYFDSGNSFDSISIVQAQDDGYNGTKTIAYNVNAVNSGLTGDSEKPVLTKAEFGTQAGSTLPVSCSASDNSGDYFYLVTDVANNYYYASFTDDFTLTDLDPAINYTFSIEAVDYSGNESSNLTTAINETKISSMTLSQNRESIVIDSPEIIQSVKLYSTTGQLITFETSTNTILTSKLAKGTYVLKVQDIQGSVKTFKVVVK